MSRATGTHSRLDSLLRRQTDFLVHTDSWRDLRSQPKQDSLQSTLRLGRNPAPVPSSAPHYSPLRERLGTTYRHQSPVSKARDNFEAFYASLKGGSRVGLRGSGGVERRPGSGRTPTGWESSAGKVGSRIGSPRQEKDLTSVLTIDSLRQAKSMLQRSGLNGLSPTYLSELRSLAALIHSL